MCSYKYQVWKFDEISNRIDFFSSKKTSNTNGFMYVLEYCIVGFILLLFVVTAGETAGIVRVQVANKNYRKKNLK